MKRLFFAFLLLSFLSLGATAQIFTEQTSISIEGLWNNSSAWADFNNDGFIDYLATGESETTSFTSVYFNNGAGNFTKDILSQFVPVKYSAVACGDYNNDGNVDVVISGEDAAQVKRTIIYSNNGDGTFNQETSIVLPGLNQGSVDWGDYNNDGYLDLLLTGYNSLGVCKSVIYKNNGNNTFTEQTSISLIGVGNSSAAWGDYNNDSFLDIIIAGNNLTDNITNLYRNNGDNTFTLQTGVSLTGIYYGTVSWADFNNDGNLDIFITGQKNDFLEAADLYRNNGDNTFTKLSGTGLLGILNSSVFIADYDNDGLVDILYCGSRTGIRYGSVYKNDGDLSFTLQTGISIPAVEGKLNMADYDNDGDLDLAVSGSPGGIILSKIYKNNTSTVNASPSAPSGLSSSVAGNIATLSWNAPTDDHTPVNGLTYNVYVGNASGKVNIVSPMSNISNGYRKVVTAGNNGLAKTITITNLPNGTYFWNVQAVDNTYRGGLFSTEQSFTIDGIVTTPVVSTSSVTGVATVSASCGGNITSTGGAAVTARGVCWSTSSTPTITDSKTTDGTGTGSFTSSITGLTENTTYYVRAYATNSAGTAYGNEVSFITLTSGGTTVTDADGNVYPTVIIGTQEWMGENLRTTKYNDGTLIPKVTDDTEWSELTSSGYCWYNDDSVAYSNLYGALYNWYTVNTGKLCPTGWHVPSDVEWNTLIDYLGGVIVAGGKLKEIGTTHWSSPNTEATNESGFTALPGGGRSYSGPYMYHGTFGMWWAANLDEPDYANFIGLTYDYGFVSVSTTDITNGSSVRCLKGTVAPVVLPTLTTSAISSIATTTATSGGNITNDGGASITAHGVCWNTSPTPTITGSKTTDGTGTGSFTSSITGLIENTTYYVRAYATNSAGTAYGNEVSFKTLSSTGTVDQTITFPAFAAVTYGDDAIVPAATSTSGLSVVYSSSDTTIAKIVAGTIAITGAGTCTIYANQPGDATYKAAVEVEQLLTVNKKQLYARADDKRREYGKANPLFTISYRGFVNSDNASDIVAPTASTTADFTTHPGLYTISLVANVDKNYIVTVSDGMLTITKARLFAVAFNQARECGQPNPELTIGYIGFGEGEDESDIIPPSISTSAMISSPIGSYSILLSGGVALNYNMILVNGELEVTPIAPRTSNINLCPGDNYTLPGGDVVNTSGVYRDTFPNAYGCDSIIITDLTVINLNTETKNVSICEGESYYAGGAEQTTSGIYTDIFTSIGGCDSIERVTHLTVLAIPSVSAGADVSICAGQEVDLTATGAGTIQWQGYAGTTITVSPAKTTIYNAVAYNSCGTKTDNVKVTVLEAPGTPEIIKNGTELYTTSDFQYQWYEVSKGLIDGATQWIYEPDTTGYYFIIASNGACISDSSEVIHMVVLIPDTPDYVVDYLVKDISVYPNPVFDELTVTSKNNVFFSKLELVNVEGKTIYSSNTGNSLKEKLNVNNVEPGLYYLIITLQKNSSEKVVKKILKK
jgi:uncharacterized protein (TIGR02145 family)